MAQLDKLANFSIYLLPFVILGIALIGSWHCSLMCGGLIMASCHNKLDHFFYQSGRLLGYLLLATLLHFLGNILIGQQIQYISIISSIAVGFCFILIGVKQLKTSNFHLPLPNFLSKLSLTLNQKTINFPFLIGFFSFLLPCGFLYAVMLATLPLHSLTSSLIIAIFFWLGTAPALISAPVVVKKILEPLRKKAPLLMSSCFIVLGILTITIKLNHKHKHNHMLKQRIHHYE